MVIDDNERITHGELTVTGRLVDASNATLFGYIDSESENQISVIYKPTAGERPLWDFPDGTLAVREVAAFLFSEFAGFHLVPFTILRDGPFGMGSVQRWIEVDEEVNLVDFAQSRSGVLRELVIFDAIINNTDRKIGHLLPSTEGPLYVCDHGVCFHSEDKLRTVLWQWMDEPLSQEEMITLEDIRARFDQFRALAAVLLTTQELDATLTRIDRLINQARFPSPSDQWPPVPWPPI